MPPHRLAKLIELVGMSANHSDRFKEQLRDQRRKLRIRQVYPGSEAAQGGDGAGEEACVIL